MQEDSPEELNAENAASHILPFSFGILTVLGCWRPISWCRGTKRFLYNCYTAFVWLFVHTHTLSQMLDLAINVRTQKDFSDNIFMLLSLITASLKVIYAVLRRDDIVSLIDTLITAPCKLLDREESRIQSRCNDIMRFITLRYLLAVGPACFFVIVASTLTLLSTGQLIFRCWLPFSYNSSNVVYVISYYQTFNITVCAFIQVSMDMLICGFIMQVRCQLEILEYRVAEIAKNGAGKFGQRVTLRTCVRHHDLVYRFAKTINETFSLVIFLQFFCSTLVLCFTFYQMTDTSLFSAKTVQMSTYTLSMLMQIFVYCWCGNETKLKSVEVSDNIFQIDWIRLSEDGKGTLLMMMKRATTPMIFSSARIMVMDLNSFVGLLKFSYSIFNLLQ